MTAEPDIATDYDDRGIRAAYAVMIELGQVLGAYRNSFVLVGGAVPHLLFPDADPRHVGTLDIDLTLNPERLAEGAYADFVELLEKAGYQRDIDGLKPFQLSRTVEVAEGLPIPVIIDLLMPREAKTTKNKPKLVPGLRVQGIDGGTVALTHTITKTLTGAMPDGRNNSVELLVASIPALLVMKGYALVQRDKKKDAYDIYYSARNFPGGPEALSEACRELLKDDVALEGFRNIAGKFKAEDDFGPATVKMFLAESDLLGDMTIEQVQVDAFRQVRAWLVALQLAG